MYSLIVLWKDHDLHSGVFELPDRRFLWMTDPALKTEYSDIKDPKVRAALLGMPAVIAQEGGEAVRVRLDSIDVRGERLKVTYTASDAHSPFPLSRMLGDSFHFYVSDREPEWTHWSIKDRDLDLGLKAKGIGAVAASTPEAAEPPVLRAPEPEAETAEGRATSLLSHPSWQGAGVIVAVAGVIVTALVAL